MPRLVPGWESVGAKLSPEEGFLLSRIDGCTSWAMLRRIAGIPPERVDLFLRRWLSEGLLVVDGKRSIVQSEGRSQPPPAPTPGGDGPSDRVAPDPSLDLSLELQQRILDFEVKLERPYHEILGVPRDADPRSIKRAYFRLSKDFHPDRYFGKRIGDFAARLDRVFKKVALAYELLIDPATRAEIDRSLGSASAEAAAQEPGGAVHKPGKRELLTRLRRQFRIPEKVLAERRFKARQFQEAARVAQHQQRWNDAASCIRLAIAFDPWSDEYKTAFAEIQAQVNQLRAAQLLEEAGGAWDARAGSEALRLYEEVLHYRPSDPEIHGQAARVALEVGDVARAREYAERACELAPEVAGHQLTLARVLRREGLREKARAVLETARNLDPQDRGVQEELRRIRQRPARSSGGMK